MRALLLALACTLPAFSPGTPAPDEPPSGTFAVRCGRLFIGDGSVRERCWLIVENGKITRIVEDDAQPPGDLPVVDASERVVMPGIVAADTDLSGHVDDRYNVTPDFLAIDGFDFLRSYERALSGGVTTAYLSPGRGRLVSGQGSVVKLAGDDLVQRLLTESACLRLNLGAASTSAPAIFEPTVAPTSDDPLLPARRQYPSSRLAQLATLRQLFDDAKTGTTQDLQGPGKVEDQYDGTALRRAALGALPLRVAAREAKDLRRAVAMASELDARLVLEDPWEIAPVVEQVAQSHALAVFRMPVRLSANNPGGENRRDETVRNRPENAAIAARAGVEVALAPGSNADLGDALLIGSVAIRHGLAPDVALMGITLNAATALGVEERVGSLAPGKDADFLVLSGDPFAIGTMVEETWVDGVRAFRREATSEVLAVTGVDRIETVDGKTIDDGVLVVADGRIKSIGSEIAVPYGAHIISFDAAEYDGAVVVPGFIDAFSSLGLSGDGEGVPAGAPGQRIADVVQCDDPTFEDAIRAGVTTVLVSGRDGGLVSGRITAIKTGAVDRESMVVAEIAGVRFVFDAIGTDAIKPLRDQIEKGRKYLEAWQKYEKALAAWKAGTGEKPAEAPVETGETPTEDPLSGTWELGIDVQQIGARIEMTAELKLAGTKVTGTISSRFIRGETEREMGEQDVSGTFEGGELRVKLEFMRNETEVVAKIENDQLDGTVQAMGQEMKITGERVDKTAPESDAKADDKDDGSPKKPKVDESLEPLKALLEKRATAVVRTNREPALRAVVKYFAEQKLSVVIHGADDAIETPGLLGDEPPNVMLGPVLVKREKGELINGAARLAEIETPLAFATGDTAGTRYLPLHAAHAVRYGLDPQAALRALTLGPAKMFGIDDRVGSLRRGKDADFVVFSANPFEMTSRVLLVVCNGRVAFDGREGGSR